MDPLDARGGLPRWVAGELERHGGGSGRRGHLCSFSPPAPTGSRLATRARPGLDRRLGLPMYGGPVPLTNTVRRRGGLNAPPACHSPCPLCQVSPVLGSLIAHRAVARVTYSIKARSVDRVSRHPPEARTPRLPAVDTFLWRPGLRALPARATSPLRHASQLAGEARSHRLGRCHRPNLRSHLPIRHKRKAERSDGKTGASLFLSFFPRTCACSGRPGPRLRRSGCRPFCVWECVCGVGPGFETWVMVVGEG